jgi:hypothetical protein
MDRLGSAIPVYLEARLKLSLFILGSLFLSTPSFAETRRVVCEFTDNILVYRDVISLGEGNLARVESIVGAAGQGGETFACVADKATYHEEAGIVRIAGQSRCADGSEGKFDKTLDLTRMELSGGWQGAVPCRSER